MTIGGALLIAGLILDYLIYPEHWGRDKRK